MSLGFISLWLVCCVIICLLHHRAVVESKKNGTYDGTEYANLIYFLLAFTAAYLLIGYSTTVAWLPAIW